FALSIISHKFPRWFWNGLESTSNNGCISVLFISYYTKLCLFSWTTVEGLNLVIVVVLVFKLKSKGYPQMFCFGYGIPFLVTLLVGVIFFDDFKTTTDCIGFKKNVWIIKIPVMCYVITNCILVGLIFSKILFHERRRESQNKSNKSDINSAKTLQSIRTLLILTSLLGLPFLLTIFIAYDDVILSMYLVLNGLAGLYLLVGQVLRDEEVKKEIRKRLLIWRKNKRDNEQRADGGVRQTPC
uniref:G-protein coupled receptors family 2 profile 2 domain-containing protein n=2 Tax=Clytia hemisphaerica TaxID=252671 RepID=A0A7M5UP24_9CNID